MENGQQHKQIRRICVIGSSGGGSGTLRSSIDIISALSEALTGIQGCDCIITHVQFIVCDHGLDKETILSLEEAYAKLYTLSFPTVVACVKNTHVTSLRDFSLLCICDSTLPKVNADAFKWDKKIASDVLSGYIDAVITISSDPGGVNKHVVEAGISTGIPFVGTGGTSISHIAMDGGLVIGSSGGSVATTITSRSLCFAASLAAHWGCSYHLNYPPSWPKFRSVCGAALPILLCAALMRRLCEFTLLNLLPLSFEMTFAADDTIASITSSCATKILNAWLQEESNYQSPRIESNDTLPSLSASRTLHAALLHMLVMNLQQILKACSITVIPVAVSALAALETSQMGSMSVLAGSVSGALLTHNSSLSGILGGVGLVSAYFAGVLTGFMMPHLQIYCASKSFLPTATTIVSVGGAAFLAGGVVNILLGLGALALQVLWQAIKIYTCLNQKNIVNVQTWFTQTLQTSRSGSGSDISVITVISIIVGPLVGYGVSWGSEQGYYHLLMLPLIALEMQQGRLAFMGALDVVMLCTPCAAICFAVWILASMLSYRHCHDPSNNNSNKNHYDRIFDRHKRLGWRGFYSNFWFGDYVEACYPYTLPGSEYCSVYLLASVRLSCAVAGVLLTYAWLTDWISMMYEDSHNMCSPLELWCNHSKDAFTNSSPFSSSSSSSSILSSAYLPLPISLLLLPSTGARINSINHSSMILLYAGLITFIIPFVTACIVLRNKIKRIDNNDENDIRRDAELKVSADTVVINSNSTSKRMKKKKEEKKEKEEEKNESTEENRKEEVNNKNSNNKHKKKMKKNTLR